MDRIPITREGYDTLKKEFERLKTVERPQNIRAIEEARAHGDLSENAEFHAAKERQAFLEARIGELEYKLGYAEIIDPDKIKGDRVVFGSRVIIENVDTGDEIQYQLVGPDESDAGNGKISVTAPLGQSLIGKRIGDEITVQAPGGKRNFELIEIL